jgi:anti-sigma regulatory factor (Ser/Thr protein kinase)
MEQSVTERPAVAADGRSAARKARHTGSLRLDLRRDTEAPATARAAVHGWCPALDGGLARLETLLLLVSEVVTNAVLHSRAPADSPILLTASMVEEKILVIVTDAGGGFMPPAHERPKAADGMTIGGYGLYVVDRAASRWGVDREGGTRVWFEL